MQLFKKKRAPSGHQQGLPDHSERNVPPREFPTGIKLLHSGDEPIADIVFVHGLTGDRDGAWKASTASESWPQALLPTKITNARILTFGYDAAAAHWQGMVSKNRVSDHAAALLNALATCREDDNTTHRPLIFVCHGLGGLVCEDALVQARESLDQHLQDILKLTHGIAFLGTPHRGSDLAKWGAILIQFVGLIKQTNPEILGVLRRESEVLARIQQSFFSLIRARHIDRLPPIEIACFYEELPLLGIGMVVPMDSAKIPGYNCIPVNGNHMDMAKFSDPADPGFLAVSGVIRRWVKNLHPPDSVCDAPVTQLHAMQIGQAQTQRRELQEQMQPGPWRLLSYSNDSDIVEHAEVISS